MSYWGKKKVLMTAGASFIASHLVDRPVTLGVSVRVAGDLSSGKLANLHDSLDRIEFVKRNLRDQSVIGQNAFGALTKCVRPG